MRAVGVAVLVATAVAASCVAVPRSAAAGTQAGKISVTFLPAPSTPAGTAAVIPIRVSNGWEGKAVGVTLSVSAPSWVKLSGPRCVSRRAGLKCSLRDLAPGADVTVRIRAKPSRPNTYRVVARASVEAVRLSSEAPDRSLARRSRFEASSRRSPRCSRVE